MGEFPFSNARVVCAYFSSFRVSLCLHIIGGGSEGRGEEEMRRGSASLSIKLILFILMLAWAIVSSYRGKLQLTCQT